LGELTAPIGHTGFAALIHVAALPPHTAAALGLEPAGAVLVRPDGHEVARWATPDTTPRPGVAWLAP
jgi:hypothetical protein